MDIVVDLVILFVTVVALVLGHLLGVGLFLLSRRFWKHTFKLLPSVLMYLGTACFFYLLRHLLYLSMTVPVSYDFRMAFIWGPLIDFLSGALPGVVFLAVALVRKIGEKNDSGTTAEK
jgi:hypothetical protein